jgi:DNA-binding Lrp family transcriptional regulator
MEEAAKLEEITECYQMAGAIDFLLRVAIGSMEAYNRVWVKKLGTYFTFYYFITKASPSKAIPGQPCAINCLIF